MIENKDLYSFTETDDTLENEYPEPAPEETETAAEPGFPYKTMSHIIISVFCILLILIIGRVNSPWADWTRARLHTAVNASFQNTFGYISNTQFFKSLIINGSRLIRLEEIRRMSARKFSLEESPASDIFQNAVWPVQGNISQGFGWREDPATLIRQFYPGVEFTAAQNAAVMAIADGEVAAVKANHTGGGEVVIEHGGGWRSTYRPMATIKVRSGEMVKSGTIIAQAANSKITLELRHNGQPVDPFTVIRN
jgi:murein DD-endopeptidase MepM/ murein hydrolase activator NlpD